MYARFLQANGFSLLFCADEEVIGKKLHEKGIEVEIKKESFGQKKVSENELSLLMKKANSINIFGKKTAAVAIKGGIAKKEDIRKISGVWHLQVFKV